MNLKDKKILLTGATGGIGGELVKQLAGHNCKLVLSGRNQQQLDVLAAKVKGSGQQNVISLAADIFNAQQCADLVKQTNARLGGLDILINLAGLQRFKTLGELTTEEIENQITVNLQAPIMLTQAALTLMKNQQSGQIVNIGSTFGSIGFANFSVYSAAKFGLRGFSEALRRELAGTNIDVTYIAPRATRTSMNSEAVYKLAKETGMNLDLPENVASEIIKAITAGKKNHFIGFPESLFAHINALVPGLVDKALYKQNLIAQKYV